MIAPIGPGYPCPTMKISLNWLNQYLDPSGLPASQADALLTAVGFPIEEERPLPDGDVYFDVEITSNRGDCLSHLGLAREVAACALATTPRRFVQPEFPELPTGSESITSAMTLDNRELAGCPRFTARIIRGITVGPSPAWLCEMLEAVGQRPINTLVDVTNWLNLAFGQPAHVFDLAKLAGPGLIIRYAHEGEPLTTLDGKARTLKANELVVADAERAQSLAGIIGGADSQVTDQTTDIVLEVACWDPVTIRTAARRHNLHTDASHRFERGVDPRTLDLPAACAAAMILQLAGGSLCEGMHDQGVPAAPETTVSLRPSRVRRIMGIDIPAGEMIALLRDLAIGIEQRSEDELICTIPPWRLDLTREIDLIEEVARTKSLDAIPLAPRIEIIVDPPQDSERALAEVGSLLAAHGYYETVTFSFISPARAMRWLGPGLELISVDDDRRKAEPTLRPSVIPSLLACRKGNQDARVEVPGGIHLVERSAVFAQFPDGSSAERRTLTLLADVPGEGLKRSFDDRQLGLRQMRGTIEALVRAMAGAQARVAMVPAPPPVKAWDAQSFGRVELIASGETTDLGCIGLIAPDELTAYDLAVPVVAAELDADALLGAYPPKAHIEPLPLYPGIERDLSIIVAEDVSWDRIVSTVAASNPDRLIGIDFVGIYRGRQVGSGSKSVTLRLRFRDPARTLRHEEIDSQVDAVVVQLGSALAAKLRT